MKDKTFEEDRLPGIKIAIETAKRAKDKNAVKVLSALVNKPVKQCTSNENYLVRIWYLRSFEARD